MSLLSLSASLRRVALHPSMGLIAPFATKSSSSKGSSSSKSSSKSTPLKLSKLPAAKKAAAPASATKAPKAEKVKGAKEEKPKDLAALLEEPPSRRTVSALSKGKAVKPKPHWAPLPDMPVSPYIMFFKEVSKDLAAQWKGLSETERKKFDDLAIEDKKRFERESAEFFQRRAPDQFYQQKLPAYLAKLDPLKPPKSPPSSYALFVQFTSKENPSLGMALLSAKAGSKWNAFSEAEKKTWQEKAAALKTQYVKEMEDYKKKLPQQ